MAAALFWLQVVETVALASAVVIAVFAVRSARKSEQQKALLAFLRDYIREDKIGAALKIIRGDKSYADLSAEEKAALEYLLNKFEILAIGLKRGIYDKKMVVDAFGDELNRIYDLSKPFIDGGKNETGRTPHDWAEFQKVAESVRITISLRNNRR